MTILSTILGMFCLPIVLLFITLFVFGVTNNFDTDSFVFFLDYILFIFIITLIPVSFITIMVEFLFKKILVKATYNKLNFNIPEFEKTILMHLIYKFHDKHKIHTSSKLNLEIEKLLQAFDNKSNIYKNLNETDFPYINKFIRRVLQVQSGCKLSNSSNLEQLELIIPEDMGKLNMDLSKVIPSNHKLLTLDSMDNELNNIIHNQMKNLNKENVELY